MNKFTDAVRIIQMIGREADLESVPHVDIRFHSSSDKERFTCRLRQLFASEAFNGDSIPIEQPLKRMIICGVRVNLMVGADL